MLLRILAMALLNIVLLCGIANATQPNNTVQSLNKDAHVGIFVFRLHDTYISLVTKALEQAFDGKVKFTVFDAKQDQVLQITQLDGFLRAGGDVVVMNLVDVKVGQTILNAVRTKDIPIIFFNKEPDLAVIKKYSKAVYVGSAAEQSGVLQGEIIAKIWHNNLQFDRNNDGVCNFLMLQGNIDNPEAIIRTKLSVRTARKNGVYMQQVSDTIVCDWDAECAYEGTKRALAVEMNNVDFIIANNDSMALGAILALQHYDFNHSSGRGIIPVVGIDGTSDAKDAIKRGIMHGTVIQDAEGMADVIAKITFNKLEGKAFFDDLPYAVQDEGISMRIPYREYNVE